MPLACDACLERPAQVVSGESTKCTPLRACPCAITLRYHCLHTIGQLGNEEKAREILRRAKPSAKLKTKLRKTIQR